MSLFDAYACPRCNSRESVHWRRGVHFDHQLRCGACDVVWDPAERWDAWQAAREPFIADRD